MNTNELEDAIRAELRAEVRQAPSGVPIKAAVLQAVAELPAPQQDVRQLRRWTVPLLAAAAVVLVAIGLTVGGRALTSSRPTQPLNQQRITPPPPYGLNCADQGTDQTLVNGAQTSYLVSGTGERRYVFEYYCAGADGSRLPSSVQVFRRVAGTLQFQQETTNDTIVLSLTGIKNGYHAVEAFYFLGDGTPPEVRDTSYPASFNGTRSAGTEVAPGCLQADLTVRLSTAQLPSPHQVLQLTNHSTRACAVWGNPRYTPLTATGQTGSQPVSYLLHGPAGGVNTAPSAPVLILQAGQQAAASIGTSATAGCLPSARIGIVLPGQVDLGSQPFSACGIEGYPLVSKPDGDDSADDSRLPAPKPGLDPGCSSARGETLVNGLQTSYTVSASGQPRYVFEYYCAGSDGHRTGSSLQVFKLVDGRLQFLIQAMRPETNNVVISLSGGGEDGFQDREANLLTSQLPFYGSVSEGANQIDGDDGNPNHIEAIGGGGPSVAAACRTADLTVRLANAQQPAPHQVLQLTNRSKAVCALWGNPHYAPQDAGRQSVSYLLHGPAGGVTSAPSAPVILLQPGATAGASIGSNPSTGSCAATSFRITLPDGVDLGLHDLGLCQIVSYPLVPRAGGDDAADYPTTLQPAACADYGALALGWQPVSTQSGDGHGLLLTIELTEGAPCTVSGYPDIRAVDGSNATLAVARHTPRGFFGGLATGTTTPPTVTLHAGQTASALVEWAAAAYTPTSTCSRNGRILVTLAGKGSIYDSPISQLCDLEVHPFVAGNTGTE